MKSATRTATTAGILLLALLLISFSTSIAQADKGGNRLRLSASTNEKKLTVQVELTARGLPDGSKIRVHIDIFISDKHTNLNRPGTLIYSGDIQGTVVDSKAQLEHTIAFEGTGYYLVQATAYDSNDNFLASAWIDPREGTAG